MCPVDNLRLPLVAPVSVAATVAISFVPSLALWHDRLGHTSSTLFILMFGGLPLSLVLVGLDILLSLLIITLTIVGFLI